MSSGGGIRSGSWVLLDNLSAAAISFGFFVVTARVLTPLEFGIAAIAVSVSQILLPLIDSLFHDAIIQRDELEPDDVQTAMTATFLWSLAIASCIILLSPLIAIFTNAPSLARYLPWMAIAAVSSGVMAVPSALARREMQFRVLAIRTVLGRSTATVIGLVLAFGGFGVWAVVVQAVLASLLSALFLFAVMRPSMRFRLDPVRLRRMMRFAAPAMGTQLLLFSSSRVFTLIFSALLGPVAAAVWSVALRFVEPLQIVSATALGQFTLPIYSRKQNDLVGLRELFITGSRRASLVLVPMFVGLGALAPLVVGLMVGPQWLPSAPLMAVVCLVFAVISSRQMVEITLTSLALPHLNLLIQAVAILLSLGGFALGATYGLFGATLGWSLRILPFVVLAAVFMRTKADVPFAEQVAAIAPSYLASGLMAAAVIGVRMLTSDWPAVLTLLVAIATGILIYAPIVLLLEPKVRHDFHEIRRGPVVPTEALGD